jgi:hypothetical protein
MLLSVEMDASAKPTAKMEIPEALTSFAAAMAAALPPYL